LAGTVLCCNFVVAIVVAVAVEVLRNFVGMAIQVVVAAGEVRSSVEVVVTAAVAVTHNLVEVVVVVKHNFVVVVVVVECCILVVTVAVAMVSSSAVAVAELQTLVLLVEGHYNLVRSFELEY